MALNPRERWLAGVTIAVGFVCLNYFGIGPLMEKWRDLDSQAQRIEGEIAQAKIMVRGEPELRARHDELLKRLREGSASQSGGDIIGRMETLASQFGVTFTQRTPSEPQERQRYIEKSAQFTFQTQWPNLVRFLFAVGRQAEVYRVIGMRVRADQKDPNNLMGDMAVLTYYLVPGAAARPPAPGVSGAAGAAKGAK